MNYPPRVIYEQAAQGTNDPEAVASVTQLVPRATFDAGGAYAGVLSDGRAVVVLVMSQADADTLATNRQTRLPSDLLADQAKPTAHTVADALIAADFGSP